MDLYLNYLFRSSICLGIFYLFYKLFLSRHTFHRLNRFTLLGILMLSVLLPLSKRMIILPEMPLVLETMISIPEVKSITASTPIRWIELLPAGFYLLGVGIMLGFFICSVFNLLYSLRKEHRIRMENNIRLIQTNHLLLSFSWMNYIVVSRNEWNKHAKEIFLHEKAHIDAGHSWDLIIMQLFLFICWFNPIVWLIKRELQTVHEYEADERVLKQGIDRKNYQYTLIEKVTGDIKFAMLVSSFNHSYLKKRVYMMLRKKTISWYRLKYLGLFPLIYLTVLLIARPVYSYQSSVINESFPDLIIEEIQEEFLTEIIEEEKKISEEEMSPEKRIEKSNTFIPPPPVLPDDALEEMVVKTAFPISDIKSSKDQLSETIARMSAKLAETRKIYPMSNLKKDSVFKNTEIVGTNLKLRLPFDRKKDLIVVIDNVVYDRNILDDINPKLIETVTVLKDRYSVAVYGRRAEGGVIIIKLKENIGNTPLRINSVTNEK